jgi:GT2 family glycosyltransferase
MNNDGMPKVSIIVVNYNGKHLIAECIDSILRQTYVDYELIVVDNGSTDGSVVFLNERYKDRISLIQNRTNLGFAGGNNVGIAASTGVFIALLNNDAVADSQWLEKLTYEAEVSDETYGMWASKILFYDKRKVIDTAGHLIYPDGLNRGRGKGETDSGKFNIKEEVIFPSGCAALYSKKMLDVLGGFDNDFFAYGDDTDIGLKARLAGWRCLYVPTAFVYHKSSSTAGVYSPLKAYLVERNRIWILIKYFPLYIIFVSIFYTLLRYVLQAYGAFTGKGAAGKFAESSSRIELLKVLFKAYYDAFRKVPLMIKKRRDFKKYIKASSGEFFSWLIRYRISAREISLKD